MFHGSSKQLRDATETFDTLTIRGHGTTVIGLEPRMASVRATVNTCRL